MNPTITIELLEQMIKNYVAFIYVEELTPIFTFAWEESMDSDFMEIVMEEIQDTNVVV